MENKIKVLELFSGIGAQTKAFKNAGIDHEVVMTSEWDLYSNISYAIINNKHEMDIEWNKFQNILNESSKKEIKATKEKLAKLLAEMEVSLDTKKPATEDQLLRRNIDLLYMGFVALKLNKSHPNIMTLKGEEIPQVDLLTYSFPCQDLSNQGHQKGLIEGEKSSLLWQVKRILIELKGEGRLPKRLLMENVITIFSNRFSEAFNEWKAFLESIGYSNTTFKLNSKYFNSGQSRTRAFMVSELNGTSFVVPEERTISHKTIADYLSDEPNWWDPTANSKKDAYVEDWNPPIGKSGIARSVILNYSTFETERRIYGKWGLCPTITAYGTLSQPKTIDNGRIRLLTSHETWQLMGFDLEDLNKVKSFGLVSESNLKKQAGNSIVVNVLEAIFKSMFQF